MKTLHIIRGLPGSGKSTYAKSLGYFHVEADMFHQSEGKYDFNVANLKKAHNFCQDMVEEAMSHGVEIVVSNTFTTCSEMEPYFWMAERMGYDVKVYHMQNSYGSIHNVPATTLQKMKDRWEEYAEEVLVGLVGEE